MAQSLTISKTAVNANATKGGPDDPISFPGGHGEAKTRIAQFADYHQIAALQARNGPRYGRKIRRTCSGPTFQ